MRDVFEQLARYTMRYHESDLHLGLHSSSISANNLNLLTLPTLPLTLQLFMFGLTDRGNEITLNSVCVMFWYDKTYMVVISRSVQIR